MQWKKLAQRAIQSTVYQEVVKPVTLAEACKIAVSTSRDPRRPVAAKITDHAIDSLFGKR